MNSENCNFDSDTDRNLKSESYDSDQSMDTSSETSDPVASNCCNSDPEKDQTVEMNSETCDVGASNCCNSDSDKELVEETINSMDEDSLSNRNQEVSPAGPTLPILQKIMCLSTKIKNLKRDHASLLDQVKSTDSFPGTEILDSIRLLSNEYELLKKKYLDESSERKRLYNEVIELKGNIRVFCRCRPLNQAEIVNGSKSVVEYDSSQENELQIVCSDSSKKQFKFNFVFKPEDNQEDVFSQTKPIVTSVLDGYNVCIFAYGQTGTGKTFTMEGTPENRGVNYRTLEELFRTSKDRKAIMRYELYVSMLEVYNEKIRDLLVENSNQPSKKLEIKQSAEGTQEVPGLTEARVYGTEEVWELLQSGARVRSVGSTNANELSSRSHCLLRVTVKGENVINGQKTRSHLWLVDLAGSERVGKIEVEGERLKESQFINKSLSALGDVISALATKSSHIPYRNSKLTHMLQSSLGGDCKTLMFVQISPSDSDLGETLCSLNFASRVRGIESGPARKQADVSELLKYKQMAEKFKHDEKQTMKLQDNLQSLQLRLASREHVCRSLQDKVRDLENQLAEERKLRMKQENRASAAVSIQSSALPSIKEAAGKTTKIEKRLPLGRVPLRSVTNFMPPPQKTTSMAAPPSKATHVPKRRVSIATFRPESSSHMTTTTTTASSLHNGSAMGRPLPQPKRRASVANLPQSTTAAPLHHNGSTNSQQVYQAKRRVSVATTTTFRPESSNSSHMTTPIQNGNRRDTRKPRTSNLFSALPEYKTLPEITTPAAAMRCSSKFMGSPPPTAAATTATQQQQPGSWKPKHPTVVALQKKSLVWSPLKLRGMKNFSSRRSFLPSQYSTSEMMQ